jgi:NAD+ kinase
MSRRDPATGPIRTVAVVAKIGPPEGVRITKRLAEWLTARGIRVLLDEETASVLGRADGIPRDSLPAHVDLAVSAGGDGTLLSVARSAAPLEIPVLGINYGSLGFITELQPMEALAGLEAVIEGRYEVEQRQTLRVRHAHRGSATREYAVLNDVVITKSALSRMIAIGVRIDEDPVATYPSDGLIVATPTGSTAYNLSAGGPILDPRMNAFVLSPICPHTMTYRPVVVPSDVTIDLTLRSPDEEVFATLDGQIGFPFLPEDRLTIDSHPRPVRLVRVAGLGFFEILRRKLRWGER